MNKPMQTRGQVLLAIEMLTRACDMRIAHWRRLSLLRYAHEVMVMGDDNLGDRSKILHLMIVQLSEYDPSHFVHSEIKGIVREVRDGLQEYHDDVFAQEIEREKKRNSEKLDDIPF